MLEKFSSAAESVQIPTLSAEGEPRSAHEIARDIERLAGRDILRLEPPTEAGLSAERALEILHGLKRPADGLVLPLTTEAILHKGLIDEAARAGCVAIELFREGPLRQGLACGLDADSADLNRLSLSLRRARGLGMATILDFPLGYPGDDEGVFERALRFFDEALVAIPRIERAPGETSSLMSEEALENGLDWARNRLVRHRAIWRRALWPSGRTRPILAAGYQQRRETPLESRGHYTATMEALRLLNRTRRTGVRRPMLALSEGHGIQIRPERALLHVRAASDSTMKTLQVAVAGSLDLRGARKLLDRIAEALRSGVEHVTIDFEGLEWVSADVVTQFIEENRDRFRAMASQARLVNLQDVVANLRRQLGDAESVRLLEAALPA